MDILDTCCKTLYKSRFVPFANNFILYNIKRQQSVFENVVYQFAKSLAL